MSAIYLHIPFCKQACTYCDFHFSTRLAERDNMVRAMVDEIDRRASYLTDNHLNSIYFGGGTPSLLETPHLAALFEKMAERFTWDSTAEVTLEANPDDINNGRLREWLQLGVNRLSIGLQSFNEAELRWMNRAHSAVQSVDSVKAAQDAGFSNLTIDLIYGSKFQTPASWEQTLKTAVELGTTHISSYNLTIENKTLLGVQQLTGKEPAVDDQLSAQQFDLMSEYLQSAGFVHYEISNFARPGHFAVHNSNYWLQKPYLGIGPSAHSFDLTSRQWNVKNNQRYMQAIKNSQPYFEKEELSDDDRYNEYVLTRLRTIWGCDLNEIDKLFGRKFQHHFLKQTANHREFLIEQDDLFYLNKQGRAFADRIASDFFVV